MLISFFAFSQSAERVNLTKKEAEVLLKEKLSNKKTHNLIGKESILKTEKKVIEFAEFVLFDIYGEEKIVKQKPYNTFKIDDYWLVKGTLPKGKRGGTFLIIMDSRNFEVLYVSHGK